MDVAIALVVVVALFLAFRMFILWYWRINEIAETLFEINQNIAKLAGETLKIKPQVSPVLNNSDKAASEQAE